MENINSEVCEKVKSAIKAKLKELGAYVDDELPDYIMILVGNKKNKDQMDDDLSLFLGHNTEKFTHWLHEVLQKLNAAAMLTASKSIVKDKKLSPKPEGVEKKKHKKKKEKSEKKKEKKEKKKKKDKEKQSSKRKHDLEEPANQSEDQLVKTNQSKALDSKSGSGSASASNSPKQSAEEEEQLPEDVVDLRPGAADLELDLDEEAPPKKKKISSSEDEKKAPTNLVFKVTNEKAKIKSLSPPPKEEVVKDKQSVHDRLKPASTTKRIINLREESSFPPSNSEENGVLGVRSVSSVIQSSVRSISSRNGSDTKPSKRLEARVRPLVSSRVQTEDEDSPRIASIVSVKRPRSSEDESDDNSEGDEPAAKKLLGVASKVEAAPRPRRGKTNQANPGLLMRAMADAEKSVSKPKKRGLEDKEESLVPTNDKKELFTRSYQERKKIRPSSSDEEKSLKKVSNSRLKESVHARLGSTTKRGSSEEMMSDQEYLEDLVEEGPEKPPHMQSNKKMEAAKSDTRFVITMDGPTLHDTSDLRSRLSGKLEVRTDSLEEEEEEEEELIEEVEEWEEVEMDLPSMDFPQQPAVGAVTYGSKLKLVKDPITQVTKKEERCRFWPTCKEGDTCKFIHPSKVCTSFPKCRFGDMCLYIHPKCKFDATCVKVNCPFTHSAPKHAPVAAAISIKPKFAAAPPKCRYFPKCSDTNCPFTHPKNALQICRYGKVCRTANCQFIHPEVPQNSALKWTASKSFAAGGVLSSASSAVVTTVVAPGATSKSSAHVLSSLSKKLEDLNSLVKKTEAAQVTEELNKLKEMTAILESAST